MKIILGLKRHCYVKRISILLIMIALIVGMVGCDGTTPAKYNLTMVANPVGGGTATDLTNTSPYTVGTVVSIKAQANEGYEFVNWTVPAGVFDNATAAETTFTMPAQNVTVTANFFQGQLIRTWYDLDDIRDNLDGNYLLTNDLDSTTVGYTQLASETANDGKGWQPIGTLDYPFVGSLDGQGYEIRDLFINRPDKSEVGLFGSVGSWRVIKDIGLMNITVTGYESVGGLVGGNGGTVSNCYVTGSVSGDGAAIGGLVGYNNGIVSNSYSSGDVTGYSYVGGLVGNNNVNVSNSYSSSSVSGDYNWVGGLVGGNGGTVSSSHSTGNVTGYSDVGGLVGVNDSWSAVSNSYSTGNVTGYSYVGGLVGKNRVCSAVSNSYSTGNVTGYSDVGGLVGGNVAPVSNSYSIGSVTGTERVGGLVGHNEGEGTVNNSFWDTETSGQATSDGGTGKNTTEMQDIATFTDTETEGLDEPWDITAVTPGSTNTTYTWNIVNNVTYPFLSWEP